MALSSRPRPRTSTTTVQVSGRVSVPAPWDVPPPRAAVPGPVPWAGPVSYTHLRKTILLAH
ncbi:hypothetical protein [Deinococcus wulumuqiensis]|uniref:hypothetical protein n=1 Tax=Deinococcus wulumuqiensis TaxID=980427 RepID=UPI00178C8EA1|nr:hypothetical protein [Deinococcus wulumuqiensis]